MRSRIIDPFSRVFFSCALDLTGESPVNGSLASLESHTFTIPAELFSQTEIGLFVRLTLPSNATADEADLYVDAVPTEDALPAALGTCMWLCCIALFDARFHKSSSW